MQSSKEQQGEIRKPSSVINAKKYKKEIEWKRLEISSRGTKGIFHARMGMIKNRNGKDLTEAEESKKWQEYTEDYAKKVTVIQVTTMV